MQEVFLSNLPALPDSHAVEYALPALDRSWFPSLRMMHPHDEMAGGIRRRKFMDIPTKPSVVILWFCGSFATVKKNIRVDVIFVDFTWMESSFGQCGFVYRNHMAGAGGIVGSLSGAPDPECMQMWKGLWAETPKHSWDHRVIRPP